MLGKERKMPTEDQVTAEEKEALYKELFTDEWVEQVQSLLDELREE